MSKKGGNLVKILNAVRILSIIGLAVILLIILISNKGTGGEDKNKKDQTPVHTPVDIPVYEPSDLLTPEPTPTVIFTAGPPSYTPSAKPTAAVPTKLKQEPSKPSHKKTNTKPPQVNTKAPSPSATSTPKPSPTKGPVYRTPTSGPKIVTPSVKH